MGSEAQGTEAQTQEDRPPRLRTRLIDHGPLLSVIVAALVLFTQLGSTGLWEPWEMDRADVARMLASQPEVVGVCEDADAIATLQASADREGVVLRAPSPPARRGATQSTRVVREAIKRAKERIVMRFFFDEALLWSEGASPGVWERAVGYLDEAAAATLDGTVVVALRSADRLEEIKSELIAATLRRHYSELAEDYELPKVDWPSAKNLAPTVSAFDHLAHLHFIVLDDSGALDVAMSEAHDLSGVARFRKDQADFTLPPLQPWLTAISYRLFGASETSTRLPTAVLAWLAVLVLVLISMRLYGPEVATVAGLVASTTPLLVAQGRLVMGEAGAMLGFVLVMMGILCLARGTLRRLAWGMLVVGFIVGLTAKGLTAALTTVLILGATVAIAPKEGRGLLSPTLMLGALFVALTAWVLSSAPDSAASQLRFTLPLFSDGPDAYHRNFDFAIKSMGFGLFPWTPVMVVAMAWMVQRAIQTRHLESLIIVVGFSVTAFIAIGFFRDYNHLMWPAAPLVALAIALAWRHSDELLGPQRVMSAFVVLVIGFILSRELGKDPAPVAGFLTYDPPFGEGSKLKFPADLSLKGATRLVLMCVVLPTFLWLARPALVLKPWLAALRRPVSFRWLLSSVIVAVPLIWLIRTLVVYGSGMNSSAASPLSAAQRGWYLRHLLGGDPLASLALGTAVGVLLVGLLRHLLLRKRLKHLTFDSLARKRPLFSGFVGLGGVLLGGHMLWVVWPEAGTSWPEGYWSTTLMHVEALLSLAVAAWCAYRCRTYGGAIVALLFFGLLGLLLGTRLARDLMWFPPVAMACNALIGVGWLGILLPGLVRDREIFAKRAAWLLAAAITVVTLPLFDRWLELSAVLYGGRQDDLLGELVLRSRASWLLIFAAFALVLNRWLPETVGALLVQSHRLMTSTRVLAVLVGLGAAGYVTTVLAEFYPSLAHHVSQKHILDTYTVAAGEGGDDLFKHGRFTGATGRDVNFYTSRIPAVKERERALRVLLAEANQVAMIETPSGSQPMLLPGWDSENDTDQDGQRDYRAEAGIATRVSAGQVEVANAGWVADQHAGKVLIGAKGKAYPIASNTDSTLVLKDPVSPILKARSADPLTYVIDNLDSPKPRASASSPLRRFMLIPTDSLSELNHAFRKLSGGRHLPIVDGRSSRVLLASSWLDEGQKQQNRYANHTLDLDAFESLNDEKVNRVWVDFDGKLKVVGYKLENDTVGRGVPIQLTVYFEVLNKVSSSQKIFMHIDKQGSSGRIHADHWPLNMGTGEKPQESCVGCYRTDHWFKGDVVLDYFEKEVAAGTASGLYDIWMGLYSPSNDKRLKVKDWEKGKVRHDGSNRVSIGTLRVR